MRYFLGVVRMRHGVGPHPDIIELRVRLYVEDANNDLDPEYLRRSALAIWHGAYLSRLDMYAPAMAEVVDIELNPETPAPAENMPDN